MLAMREEVDYRIIYMAERQFKERVEDVYIAKQTTKKAPSFHDILQELIDVEACLFVLHREEEFCDFTEEQRKELIHRIESEDIEALELVLSRLDKYFIEMFAKDLYLFLVSNQYSFFEHDPYDPEHIEVYNSSIQPVW